MTTKTSSNHTPDLGCYLPTPEEIEAHKQRFRKLHLAAKRKTKPSVVHREPVVHGMACAGRVIRKVAR